MSRLGRIAVQFLGSGARIALWPARVAAARAVAAQLAAMDARDLADIGLTPQDVRDATAVPLDVDPTRMLADRAAEARTRAIAARPVVRTSRRRPHAPELVRTGS